MRTRSAAFALALLAAAGVSRPAHADPKGAGDVAVGAARDIWQFIQQIRGEGSDSVRALRSRPQAAQPQPMADELRRLCDDRAYRDAMVHQLEEVRASLGEPGAARRVAGFISARFLR